MHTDMVPDPAPPCMHLHAGICKPKIFSDGTVCYAYSADSGKPYMVKEALSSPNMKVTVVDEYIALMRNKTGTLVPLVFDVTLLIVNGVLS
jgi:hypothetical protein